MISLLSDYSWRVRHTAYQYLYEVYIFYKKDSLKECVRNAVWDVIERFREKEKNVQVLGINKFDEKVCEHFSYYLETQSNKNTCCYWDSLL